MERLLEILREMKSDVDWENEENLFDDEILDSFDIISLIGDINDTFGVEISVLDVEPENFNSVEAIWELVSSKM